VEKNLKIAVILSAIDKMSGIIGNAVNKSTAKLDQLSKKTNLIANKAFDIGRSSGAVGLAIAAPLGLAIKAAAQYEKMNISLRTAFQGNEVAAAKAFKEINKFAAQTPYELEEVMRGFVKLKNMGLDPSQKALTAYGNIASGMGKSLNDMVEAVADAATGEFERLKEFGIKAKSQGDMVSFTFQGVTTKVKKNSKEIEQYLKNVGNTKFKGGIEAQSKSILGQFSTLKDNANMVAVKLGQTLIPALNRLFKAIMPVIDKVTAWIDRNPKLTQTIMMVAAGAAALMLAVSAVSFVVGGVFKVISLASTAMSAMSTIMGVLSTAFAFLGNVIRVVTIIMMSNPILLIITLIAMAAALIYKYWEPIKKFFINLWQGIKDVFKKAWNWIINLPFMLPVKLIIDNWGKIKEFFGNLWTNVKQKFMDFHKWMVTLPSRMYNAGANIVKSIWEGIKAFVNKPIDAIKGMVSKIREYLPFSPAKVGALKDIHKIRLVETIAQSVKPGPLVKAMKATTAAAMVAGNMGVSSGKAANSLTGGGSGGGGGITVHYSPKIIIQGSADKDTFEQMLKKNEKQLMKVIEEAVRKANRNKF